MPATPSTTLANRAASRCAVHVFWVHNIHLAVQLCTPHHLLMMPLAESLSIKIIFSPFIGDISMNFLNF
jgi:hypothetical protein